MQNSLVSINITTFNRSHLLSRCINSVLNQSYNNIEVIVVDDCSSDKTLITLKEIEEKDSRVRVFTHKKIWVMPKPGTLH